MIGEIQTSFSKIDLSVLCLYQIFQLQLLQVKASTSYFQLNLHFLIYFLYSIKGVNNLNILFQNLIEAFNNKTSNNKNTYLSLFRFCSLFLSQI